MHNTRSRTSAKLGAAALGAAVSICTLIVAACQVAPLKQNAESRPTATMLTGLGRALFFDSTLSASGRTACATCHDPKHAFGPSNDDAVQLAGPVGTSPGLRAVPSLKYAQDTPPFTQHFRQDDGNDSDDQGPAGGRTWDGRVSSAHEQAALPLLSAFEMANASRGAVLARLRHSASARVFRAVFGPRVFDDSVEAWNGLLAALEVFQESPAEFYPYTSKYDAVLRGQAQLNAAEGRGLSLFNDRKKGNCAQCHPSGMERGGFPQFTDRGFVALGLPRNPKIPANSSATYFDLGLCGPLRTDLADRTEFCGAFKTPTLRNVARRSVFFHNGVFTSIEAVLRFYAQRDVYPERFYPRDGAGRVRKFDDMPREYWPNVTTDPPFDRRPGDAPTLNEAEMADIIAFLRTLDDGYQPLTDGHGHSRVSPPPSFSPPRSRSP